MTPLVRAAIVLLYPRTARLPGAEDCDLDAFLERFRREASPLVWLGVILGAIVFHVSPLFTVHVPLPAFMLSPALADRHAERISQSPVYLVRQTIFLVKFAAGLAWGAHPSVREQFALPKLPDDPGYVEDVVTSHVSFRSQSEPDFDAEVDYVVVGSGAGGATAAVTLARSGARVAIVEAGAWRDPDDYPSSAYGGMRDLMEDWGAQVTRGRALWPVVQARTVGGTTVVNSAICVRTPDDIFTQWEAEHGIRGLKGRVLAAEDRVEREVGVEEVPYTSRGRSNRLAKLGADTLGWADSHYMRRYTTGCEGTGQCLQGCRGRKKQSMNLNYIPETQALGGVVLSSAPVDRVLSEGTRAVGVTGRFVHPTSRAEGTRFRVRARKGVVVAASVTHSPLVLHRSGVRSPALGKFFRSHPGTGVFGCYDEPVDMNLGATQGWASVGFRVHPGLKLETLAIPPELVASRFAGGGTALMARLAEFRHVAMWCHAVRAESVGSIAPSLFGTRPVVRYELNAADMERCRQGIKLLALQHFAAGAKAIIPGVVGLPYKLTADQVGVLDDGPLDPRCYTAILSHLFGGCVMGRDPRTSVVDSRGRVHGWDRLVVADASVIPTNLGVNPQHTIMGLAATFAADMAGG